MSQTSNKIASIQALRGLAIVTVFLAHTVIWYAFAGVFGVAKEYHTGDLGVELFFVISGFVVSLSLHKGGFGVAGFYLRRVFRLMPAMVIMLILGVAVSLIAKTYFPEWPMNTKRLSEPFRQAGYVLVTALTVRVYRGKSSEYCFNHTWSLNVEVQFYFALGVVILFVGVLFGRGNRDRTLKLLGVAAAVGCAALHAVRMAKPEWPVALGQPILSNAFEVVKYLIHWRFDFLLSGVVLYALSVRYPLRLPSNLLTSAVLAVTVFAPFLYMGWTGAKVNSAGTGWAIRTVYLVTNACFACAVLLGSRNVQLFPRGSIADVTLHYLGERSYTIYLIHYPMTLV